MTAKAHIGEGCSQLHSGLSAGRWIEEGAAALEAVILVPVAMVLLLFVVQACLWAHATAVTEYAAAQGARIGSLAGSSPQAGVERANSVLSSLGKSEISSPEVQVRVLPDGNVAVRVSGYLEAVLPGIRLPLSAEQVGQLQTFHPDR